MPYSTQGPTQHQRDRHLLLESLQAFSAGIEDAPLVTKCTYSPKALTGSGREPDSSVGGQPITFVLSTDDVDRHGDIISADGWVLDSYRANPVLLWAHDYRHPAIGRAEKLWAEPHQLLAEMDFAPTEFAQEIAALYRSGFQSGVSVGFKPLRYEERRDEKTGAFLGLRFLEQELLEVSAVPVPANRNALRRSQQLDDHALNALWPVLAAQVDELAKLAGEMADTLSELETMAKEEEQPALLPDLIAVLRAGRN